MRKHFFVLVILIAAFIFNPVSSVLADAAPPEQPPGSLLDPGKNTTTKVQMVSEKVTIQVGNVASFYYFDRSNNIVNAEVSASFFLQNQGQKDEKMQARFPLTNFSGYGDGYGRFPEIQNFRVWVNQVEKKWVITETPNLYPNKVYFPIKWASFDVTFPVGKQVQIDVTYQMQSTGYLPQARFDYILETGAGWFGPIGSGEIILTLPYPATNGNINLSESTSGGQMIGNSVTWNFTNLEPTSEDNWHALIVSPDTWQSILDNRLKLEKTPEDVALLTALGEKYEELVYGMGYWNMKDGTAPIILLCREVYQKAIAIKPGDADLHVKLAGILFAMYKSPEQFKPAVPTAEDIYHELKSAYILDPHNREISSMYEELTSPTVNLPPLAAEPTTTVTHKPTPTFTSPPPVEKNNLPPATSGDNSLTYELIGLVIVLILVIIVLVILRKKGNK